PCTLRCACSDAAGPHASIRDTIGTWTTGRGVEVPRYDGATAGHRQGSRCVPHFLGTPSSQPRTPMLLPWPHRGSAQSLLCPAYHGRSFPTSSGGLPADALM